MKSSLPIYRNSIDWDQLYQDYPLPDVFAKTVFLQSADEIRQLQNKRFLKTIERGWNNKFYSKRWHDAGLGRDDIQSLDDITKIPTYTSDDVKNSLSDNPPFGDFHDLSEKDFLTTPFKVQTSGGTTGKPRPTLSDPQSWEIQALTGARALYIQGARPGDVMQIPMTCSLANAPWLAYKACHDYLGVMPITSGSGVVTSSRQQVEIALQMRTNLWQSFPEYLLRIAQYARDEMKQDVRELNTKFLRTYLGPDLEGTLRKQLEDVWGCRVYDAYGTNEIAAAAFECQERNGLHFMEDTVYLEVIDVDTGLPVKDGQRGNLVATAFFRNTPPIIRYNLRDLARVLSTQQCACGSHFRRMDHLLGRSDAMVKIKGVNIYPMACLSGVKSDPRTTGEWICVVDKNKTSLVAMDELTVHVEIKKNTDSIEGLQHKLEARFKEDLGIAVVVNLVEEGSLDDLANTGGKEGKARRLLDNRYQNQSKD